MKLNNIKGRLLAAALCLLGAVQAQAYDFMSGGVYYNILSMADMTCEVTRKENIIVSSYSGDIVIPEKVTYSGRTFTVTAIGDYAFGATFYSNSSQTLFSVKCPDTVTLIGDGAFRYCPNLVEVECNGATAIGSYAFSSCASLTDVHIRNATEIGDYAFRDCSSLKNVNSLGFSVIGEMAFYNCANLEGVTISNSATAIGSYAFSGCSSLKSITIPNSVTEIGAGMFENCSSLTGIKIPDSVTEIGSSAFENCTSLTGIKIPDSVTEIGRFAFKDCTSLTDLTIGNSVTDIGVGAFEGCTSLTNVIIPNSVTTIGDTAFENCTSLTNVGIGNSVTTIGISTFENCTNLASVTIGSSVTKIDDNVFYGCDKITTIYSLNPTPPSFILAYGGIAFESSVYENATLYVPKGSLKSYLYADYWRNFLKFREFDPTGIAGVEVDGGMDVSVDGGNVVVSNAAGRVAVYSLAGALVGMGDGGERTVIAVPGAGIYVVKAGGRAVKVMVK